MSSSRTAVPLAQAGPLGGEALVGRHAEDGGAALAGVAQRHGAGGDDRAAVDGGDGDGGVVDDPVDDHLRHVLLDGHAVGGDAGDLPGELLSRGKSALDG
jgi:hypothetical protein